MRDSIKELGDLLRARIQCIWVNTYEEGEAMKDIKEVISGFPNIGLGVWSQTSGLLRIAVHPGEVDDDTYQDMQVFKEVCRTIHEEEQQHHKNCAYVFRDLGNLIDEADTRRAIRDLKEQPARNSYNPFIVLGPLADVPADITQLFRVIEYGLPSDDRVREIVYSYNDKIRQARGAGKEEYKPLDNNQVEAIVKAAHGLSVKEITMVLSESSVKEHTLSEDFITKAKIEAVKKSGALDFRMPKITLDDVGGNDTMKKWLSDTKKLYMKKLNDKSENKVPLSKGYIAVGIPGAGKTLLAEAFAGEMHWPLLELNMGKVMSSLVGESEKRINFALDVVRASAPCVFLLDEVEKALGGINSSNNSDSGITARVFKAILEFMNDNRNVFVVMTSNDVSQLPPELTRIGRLDTTWYFGLPRKDARKEILRIGFRKFGYTVSDDLLEAGAMAAEDYTGAEMTGIAATAITKAYINDRDVNRDDIEQAVHEVIPIARSSREKIIALENYCASRARRSDEEAHQEAENTADTFDTMWGADF